MEIILSKLKEILTEIAKINTGERTKFNAVTDRLNAIIYKKFGEKSSYLMKVNGLVEKVQLRNVLSNHLVELKNLVQIIIDDIELTETKEQEIPSSSKRQIIPGPVYYEKEHQWSRIHVIIQKQAKPRFENSQYADAVEAAFKEINRIIKKQYHNKTNIEEDGDSLMRKAFSTSINNNYTPVFKLADNNNESGRNIQQGYMDIFAGSMKGIRNPKAHANLDVNPDEAWEMLVLASHLMRMWDKHN